MFGSLINMVIVNQFEGVNWMGSYRKIFDSSSFLQMMFALFPNILPYGPSTQSRSTVSCNLLHNILSWLVWFISVLQRRAGTTVNSFCQSLLAMRALVYCPYLRSHDLLTIWRCNYKGNRFSSIIFKTLYIGLAAGIKPVTFGQLSHPSGGCVCDQNSDDLCGTWHVHTMLPIMIYIYLFLWAYLVLGSHWRSVVPCCTRSSSSDCRWFLEDDHITPNTGIWLVLF